MDERIAALEAAVTSLQDEVEQLRARVGGLEGAPRPVESEVAAAAPPPVALEPMTPFDRAALLSLPVLVGRTLIILAGAFLLRALTEAGGVSMPVGIGAGLAYASFWMLAAWRAARADYRTSAAFHAICAATIVFPLVWEATARLQILQPTPGSLVTAAFAGFGLLLGARARLPVAAWVFGLGGILTEATLLPVDSPGFFATAAAVAIAGAVASTSDDACWSPLEWLLAFAVDVMVLRIVALAVAAGDPSRHIGPVDPGAAAAVALSLPAMFVFAVLWRTARDKHPVRVFDLLQVGAAAALGFLGAVRVVTSSGHSAWWLGVVTLVTGALALASSFSSIKRRPGRGRRFVLLSSLGFACALIGVPTLLGRPGAAAVWAVFAAVTAFLGGQFDRISLRVHAVLYGFGAAVASGSLERAVRALVPGQTLPLTSSAVSPRLLVELVLVGTIALMAIDPGRMRRTPRTRLPFTALVGLTALVLAGGSVATLASLLTASGAPEGGSLASARTMALAAAAVVLAVLGRRRVVLEGAWLVYPVLALALLELVVGDLAQGSARTLFLSFLFCGVALVVCPWLLRGARDGRTDSARPAR